jgi:hypothetical protein
MARAAISFFMGHLLHAYRRMWRLLYYVNYLCTSAGPSNPVHYVTPCQAGGNASLAWVLGPRTDAGRVREYQTLMTKEAGCALER